MRIHTDKIAYTQIFRNALKREQDAGRIASHVTFKTLQPHRSSVREFAFEVQLQAGKRDSGRRAGNSGSYGAMIPEVDGYAATFDEWGWLLSALYVLDSDIMVGSASKPIYDSRVAFDHLTGLTYNPGKLLPMLVDGHWPAYVHNQGYTGGDPYPYMRAGAGKAGRRGQGRDDGNKAERWPVAYKLAPRNPHDYRAFAHYVEEVSA